MVASFLRRRGIVALFLAVIIAGLGGLTTTPPTAAAATGTAAEPLAGVYTGTVFRDLDNDGVLDTGEPGVGGVTITAYNQAGAAGTATSAAGTGTYSLSATGTGPYRFEISGYDSFLQPAIAGGTTVQFRADGGGTGLNFGLQVPADYCQANPELCTPIQRANRVAGEAGRSEPGVMLFPYNTTGTAAPTELGAPTNALGSTWGVAAQPTRQRVFLGAFLKRHSGLGPNGLAGLYQIDYDGDLVSSHTLSGSGIDFGTINRDTTVGSNFYLPTSIFGSSIDLDAFDKIGRVGMGDLEFSDANTLWAVNLNQNGLVRTNVSTGTPTGTTQFTIPAQSCPSYTLQRISAGASGFVDSDGRAWSGDQGYVSGSGVEYTPGSGYNPSLAAIANTNTTTAGQGRTSDTRLYRSVRLASSGINYGGGNNQVNYAIPAPVANTSYLVTLHFAEIAGANVGQRLLDISIEGSQVLNNFDIRSAAGAPNRAVTRQFTVTVNGTLDINIVPDGSSALPAMISGIEFVPVTATPPTLSSGTWKPWGLKFHDGFGYVGGVCNGENSQRSDQLTASVLRFDPANPAGGFTEILNVNLGYARERAGYIETQSYWNGWANIWEDLRFSNNPPQIDAQWEWTHPQPILSDIEFTDDGDMVLGIMDRFAHQSGAYNAVGRAGAPFNDDVSGDSGGDILHACLNAATGAYTIEGTTGCLIDSDAGTSYPLRNTDGIGGGGEFYWQDFAQDVTPAFHAEVSLGALARLPGRNEIVSMVYDPLNEDFSQGTHWYNTTTGARTDAWRALEFGGSPTEGTFGKAGGTGDIELLCLAAPVQIGNFVWRDNDGDGIQDAGEPGIAAVTMNLYSAAGALITTSTTDANGQYLFNLDPYTYPAGTVLYVGIAPAEFDTNGNLDPDGVGTGNPAIGAPTAPNTGQGLVPDNNDSDFATGVIPTQATVWGTQVTITGPGFNNHTYDVGIAPTVSIGRNVWYDANNNGLLDAGEVGISGVTVNVYLDANNDNVPDSTTPLATTTTNATGEYAFYNLAPNNYVVVIPSTNFTSGQPLFGALGTTQTGGDPDTDADNNDNNGLTTTPVTSGGVTGIFASATTLSIGGEPINDAQLGGTATGGVDRNGNGTVDFGFVPGLAIGNFVWQDTNANGIQDGGEPGINGVTVNLYLDADNNNVPDSTTPVATTTTAGGGLYTFTNLLPNNYVVVIMGTNFTSGQPLFGALGTTNGGDPDTVASNTDSNGVTATPVTSGGVNGIFASATTLSNNSEPTGDAVSGSPLGTTNSGDSNGNGTVDFGFVPGMAIGNFVWQDTNANGVQDGGEPGINGVTINLYLDANNDNVPDSTTPVATTTTAGGGLYTFTNLLPNNYVVGVMGTNFTGSGVLVGALGTTNGGDPDTVPSNTDSNGATAAPVTSGGVNAVFASATTLAVNTEPTGDSVSGSPLGTANSGDSNGNGTVDFGFVPSMAIGNFVWQDTNANGIQDSGEPGINGVTVNLYLDADNNNVPDSTTPVATTTTAGGGLYSFTNLLPNNYVVVIMGTNFTGSGVLVGALATVNAGDPDTVAANNDSNGIPGVQTLGGVNGIFASATTLVVNTEPTGDSLSGSALGTANSGDSNGNGTVDFGFVPGLAIGNFVWQDTNNNGTQDAGEPGIPNVVINVYLDANNDNVPDSTTPVATTTTNASGNYTITGLLPNNYVVVVMGTNFNTGGPLESAIATTNGGDPDTVVSNTDSNGIPGVQTLGGVNGIFSSATTLIVNTEPTGDAVSGSPLGTPNSGDSNGNGTVDFGFVPGLAIGNFVWQDTNANGTQDAGEPGINGVTVNLYLDANNDNVPDSTTPVATTTTAGGGLYIFNSLPANNYVVVVMGTNFTGSGVLVGAIATVNGGDPDTVASNNDSNGIPGVQTIGGVNGIFASATTLAINTEPTGDSLAGSPLGTTNAGDSNGNGTVDFGFVPGLSIGNLVWLDSNGNGTQDAGEPGIDGVLVNVYLDANNDGIPDSTTPVGSATTSGGGLYTVNGLLPNNYVVVVMGSNFTSGQPLNGAVATTNGGDPDTVPSNTDSNGIPGVQTLGGVNGIFASATTLAVNTEPTGDDVSGSPLGTANSGDSNGNGTVDFGFVAGMAIGNFVWQDTNANGTQDVGEPGIDGVTVNLYLDADNNNVPDSTTPVGSTTTAGGGLYSFTNLLPNNYVVVIMGTNFTAGQVLNGAVATTNGGDPDTVASNTDSNAIPGLQTLGGVNGIFASATTLVINTEPTGDALSGSPLGTTNSGDSNGNGTVDFGFVPGLAIGNFVWQDTNANGQQDGGEPGIDGVAVNLYLDADNNNIPDSTTPVGSTTTAGGGLYSFNNLLPNNYVVVILGTNFSVGQVLNGTRATVNGGDPDTVVSNTDSNGGINLQTLGGVTGIFASATTLAINTEPTGDALSGSPLGTANNGDSNGNGTVDFGFVPGMSIGNFIWQDTNANGLQDAGEPGIPNIVVNVYLDANNDNIPDSTTPTATTTTNASGIYSFTGLLPNNYVVVVLGTNFNTGGPLNGAFATTNGGDPDTVVSNTDSNGITRNPVTSGGVNGIFASATTLVVNTEPTGDALSGSALGTTNSGDSNGNGTVDFGFVPGMSIGNFIWIDANGNGLQDAGEPGIPNVTVNAYLDANNDGVPDSTTPVATTLTNGSGIYSLTNLPPNNYVVVVPGTNFTAGQPLNGAIATTNAGDPDINAANNDSNGIPGLQTLGGVNGLFASATTLAVNTEPTGDALSGSPLGTTNSGDSNGNGTVDFGFVTGMAIGNYIWEDTDADGIQDAGEPPVANVQVACYLDANNDNVPDSTTPVATATTNASGIYSCNNLTPNNYVVVVLGSNFNTGSPLAGATCSPYGGDADTNASNTDSNGINSPSCVRTVGGVTGVFASATTLIINTEPTGDALSGGTFGTTNAGDSNGNGTVDFGFFGGSLAVTLNYFDAMCRTSDILASWETASEIETLGFNLYRSTVLGELGTQLNGELIPSQSPGGGQGALYEFADAAVENNTTYYYTLEALSMSGAVQQFGQVDVAYPCAPTAVSISSLNVSNSAPIAALPIVMGSLLLAAVGVALVRRQR